MIGRIVRSFASLRLTVVLLLTLAMVLAYGTIFEAEESTPAVKIAVWRSVPFDALLGLVGLNILGCTYLRRPKRTSRWAYLLLHNAILVIFAGALIGRFWGIEGTLAFQEGEEKNYILSEASILYARWNGGSEQRFSTAWADSFPRQHTVDASLLHAHLRHFGFHPTPQPLRIPFPARGVTVLVDQFFPTYKEIPSAMPAAQDEGPAVQIEFSMNGQTETQWLFARPPGSGPTVGGLRVGLEEGAPPKVTGTSQAGKGGVLEISAADGSYDATVPIDGIVGQTVPVQGTGLTLTVREVYSHFRMGKDQTGKDRPVDDPSGPENPAVIFALSGGGIKSESRVAFANYPDFDAMHGRTSSTIRTKYLYLPRRLTIYRDAGGKLQGRYVTAGETTTGPLAIGRAYPLKDTPGLSVKLLAQLAHAVPTTEATNADNEVKNPALHLRVLNAGGEVAFWLPIGESKTLAFGPSKLTLEYGKERIDLDFSLALRKFKVGRYPGTMNPSAYASTVTLKDDAEHLNATRVISMNAPLVHHRYTFYQSSYEEGAKMTSVLQVAYDPGGPVAYLGFIGFILGLFCIISSRAPKTVRAGGDPTSPVDRSFRPGSPGSPGTPAASSGSSGAPFAPGSSVSFGPISLAEGSSAGVSADESAGQSTRPPTPAGPSAHHREGRRRRRSRS